jgi:hypothetical protein
MSTHAGEATASEGRSEARTGASAEPTKMMQSQVER